MSKPFLDSTDVNINMEGRVRANHPLRRIASLVDFDFVYKGVKEKYGNNGNESVPPPIILKLMLLLVFYNVRSERELMETLPERLDWLWFLGYDLETEIPDHSVLSKARKRWGVEIFREFFERIVFQCVEAKLVDGRKIFMDSSLVEADASCNSVMDTRTLKGQLRLNYLELEKRLEEPPQEKQVSPESQRVNQRYVSTTDPDASLVRRGGGSKPRYQVHRVVDGEHEIVTATEVTPGEVNEAHRMEALVDQHVDNTGRCAQTVVADGKYGTAENYLSCSDRGLRAHIPDLGKRSTEKECRKAVMPASEFHYDPVSDTYECHAGNRLKRRSVHEEKQTADYAAPRKACAACGMRARCTESKSGRVVVRHFRQETLERMREASRTSAAQTDIRTRQHLMERSFARAQRYGFARMRWRRLWRARIQEYLTATIQNIEILVRRGSGPKAVAVALENPGRMLRPFMDSVVSCCCPTPSFC